MTFNHLNISIYMSVLFFAAITSVACSGGEEEDSPGGPATGGESSTGGAGTGAASSSGGTVGTGGDSATGAIFGDSCADDSTCPVLGEFTGYCRDIWPGGYCSVSCSFAGECGAGNVCDIGLGTCLKACENDADCREDYSCSEDWGGCEPM